MNAGRAENAVFAPIAAGRRDEILRILLLAPAPSSEMTIRRVLGLAGFAADLSREALRDDLRALLAERLISIGELHPTDIAADDIWLIALLDAGRRRAYGNGESFE